MDGTTLNLMSLGMGLLLVLLALPMILGKLRPNRIYGFRTRKTLSDPGIWYPANRAAGLAMLVSGLLMMTASACIMLLWKNAGLDALGVAHIVLWAAALGGMTWFSFRALRKLPGGERTGAG